MVFFSRDLTYFLGTPGFFCGAILGRHDSQVLELVEGYFGALKKPNCQPHHGHSKGFYWDLTVINGD